VNNPFENTGHATATSKRFYVTIENAKESFEVPVMAMSLEEASDLAQEYVEFGFEVTRIRPQA